MMACSAMLAGCENGLLHQAAPPEPARVAIAYSLQGGDADAYEKANRIWLRFTINDEVRLEDEFAFSPAGETHVPIDVPLRELSESFTLALELRLDQAPIFRGSAPVSLGTGRPVEVNLTLAPVVASVVCAGPTLQFASYGDSANVSGAALFATNDTIFGQALTWSATSAIITVATTGARSARVFAVSDGTAQVRCAVGQATDTRAVNVAAVVQTVTVAPATATIIDGNTQTFAATVRDARGNVLTGRTVAWTSTNPSVASVTQAGVVTGQSPGTARIDATSGSALGSANVTVLARAPAITTVSANVTRLSAVLNGSANPNGAATTAGFHWGTSATLAGATTTPTQSVGSGAAPVAYAQTISDLAPSTTYFFRAFATNAGGTATGSILSFRTPDPGPPVATTISGSVEPAADYRLTFNGEVIPMGSSTQAFFQYGTSANPDSMFSRTQDISVGSGWDPVPVSDITFGTPTTYYFRIVAFSRLGTSFGAVMSIPGPVFTRPVAPVPNAESGSGKEPE
jgi:hypothetical protein